MELLLDDDPDVDALLSELPSEVDTVFAHRATLVKHFKRYVSIDAGDSSDYEEDEESSEVLDHGADVLFDLPAAYYVNDDYNFEPSLSKAKANHIDHFRQRLAKRSVVHQKMAATRLSKLRLNNRERDAFVRPLILLQRLKKRETFSYVRACAMQMMEKSFRDELQMVIEANQCEEGDEAGVPHGMFSWNSVDFFRRRRLESVVWIDLLAMDKNQHCLEMSKLKIDILELRRLFRLIVGGFEMCLQYQLEGTADEETHVYVVLNPKEKSSELFGEEEVEKEAEEEEEEGQGDIKKAESAMIEPETEEELVTHKEEPKEPSEFDLGKNVLQVIADAFDYIDIYEKVNKELMENYHTLRIDLNQSLAIKNAKRVSKDRFAYAGLEKASMMFSLLNPIEMRYQHRYYDTIRMQAEHRANKATNSIEEQIAECVKAISLENYCSQCTLNTLYTEIEDFKREINAFQQKYNNEYETIDNKNTVKRMALEKVKESRRVYGQELVRMREAVARVKAADAEAERLYQLRLQEEEARRLQAEAEAELKRKNKGRKAKKK